MVTGIDQQIQRLNQQVVQLLNRAQTEQAFLLATQACELARRHFGDSSTCYADCLNNLASVHWARGDFRGAEPLYRRTLAIREQLLGGNHPDTAASLDALAVVLCNTGDYSVAERLHLQALAIWEKVRGPEHADTSTTLNNLAELLRLKGDLEGAEPLFRRALGIWEKTLGPDHPDTATCINNLALVSNARGDYVSAEPLFRRALAIAEKALGPNHPDTAGSIQNLAMVLDSKGDYREAEVLYRRALAVSEATRGPVHPQTAAVLSNLASIHKARGDFSGAEPLYRRALAIREQMQGGEHPDTASSLDGLATLLQAQGSFAAAETLYRRSLAIRTKMFGSEHPQVSLSLNNLATLLKARGDYAAAGPLFRRALALRDEALGPEHPDTAVSHGNLASFLDAVGDLSAAENHFRRALTISDKLAGPDHPITAVYLNSLAMVLLGKGEFYRAEPLIRRALEIRTKKLGGKHPDTAISLNNLASLYQEMGNYGAAKPLMLKATSITRDTFGDNHPDYGRCLNNTAMLFFGMRDYSAAEDLNREACDVFRKAFGDKHPHYAQSINNLAFVTRNIAEAASLHRQALAIRKDALGEHYPDYAQSLNSLGWSYHHQGNYAAAEPHYRQAAEVFRTSLGDNHAHYADSLHNLADLCVATDRKAEAFTLMQQAVAIDDRVLSQVLSLGSESQSLAFLHKIQGSFAGFLSFLLHYLPGSVPCARVGLDMVLRRKAIVAEAVATQRHGVLGGKYPTLQPKLRELTVLGMQIARKTLEGSGPEGLRAHQELLADWNGRRARLEAELSQHIPELHLEDMFWASDSRAVALALPEAVSLIEFVRFDVHDFKAVRARGEPNLKPARYVAFVLSAGESVDLSMIDLGEAEPIDRLIAGFRAGITGESEENPNRDMVKSKTLPVLPEEERSGRDLRAAVFDPVTTALGGRMQLLLAPDGDLSRLPFEILPTDNGRRLIDDYCISYIGCGRDVLRFQTSSTGHSSEALVVADPHFDLLGDGKSSPDHSNITAGRQSSLLSQSSLSFDRLLGTRDEGELIARLLNVRPRFQAQVLEQRLKQVRSPWILHLATHGFFLSDQDRDPNDSSWIGGSGMGRFSGLRLENPLLRSGLALAGGNTWLQKGPLPPEAEDGLLTAEDVTGMDLLDTELVVLSACDTGLGEIRTGEGVFGLRRAFVLAGAKTLVMSLWKVPDKETRELMEDFYRRILAGEPRAEALRNAQLTMKAKYPHPFFWGAFICQGHPGPLPPRRRWYYKLDDEKGHGPVSDAELRDLVRTGKLTRSSNVSLDRKTWHKASDLKGIKWPAQGNH